MPPTEDVPPTDYPDTDGLLEERDRAQDARDDAQDAEAAELKADLLEALERIDELEDDEQPPTGPTAPGPVASLVVNAAGVATWGPAAGAPTGYDVAIDGTVIAIVGAEVLTYDTPATAGQVIAVRAFVVDEDQADHRLEGPAVTHTVPAAPPGPQPSDTVSTWEQLAAAADRVGITYVAGRILTEAPLVVRAGAVLVGAPDAAAVIDGSELNTSEGFVAHVAGALELLEVRGPGAGDRGCVEVRGTGRLHLVSLLDGGGSALAAFGGDDTPDLAGVLIDRYYAYACYLQGDVRGALAIGNRPDQPNPGPDYLAHIYGTRTQPSADLDVLTWGRGRITAGGPGGIGRLVLRADVDHVGDLKTAAMQAGYGGTGGRTANIDVRSAGCEYGVEVSGPWSDALTVRSRGHRDGVVQTWGQAYAASATIIDDGPLGPTARVVELGNGRAFVPAWNGAPVPAGWRSDAVIGQGHRLRVHLATAV